jgi:hypothetical protein
MAQLNRLFLLVHLNAANLPGREGCVARWRDAIRAAGADPAGALCFLSSGAGDPSEVREFAVEHFGARCILDPSDTGAATQGLMAADMQRAFSRRGRFVEWTPYELWSSCMARKWTEGLRVALEQRGLSWAPETLEVISWGQAWDGCLAKYSMMMPRYLGVERTPDVRADLCALAGTPRPGRFVERVRMARHVSLYLFEGADGRPTAQFFDGLRAIWEPPHVALIDADPRDVELIQSSPNERLPLGPPPARADAPVVADVGDGCRPRLTTVVGKGSLEELRALLLRARIEPAQVAPNV